MQLESHPTGVHPDLTRERLGTIAVALAEARDGAQRGAIPELGDDAWSIGCVAYSRGRAALIALAKQNPGWLTIINSGMKFVFQVGCIPVRFYHGDGEDPPARHEKPDPVEKPKLQLALPGFGDGLLAFRLAVQTDQRGYARQVELIRLMETSVTGVWVVWNCSANAAMADLPQARELDAPPVTYDGEDRATGTEGNG